MIQIKGMKACSPAQDPMCGWNMRHAGDDNISFDELGAWPMPCVFPEFGGREGFSIAQVYNCLAGIM